MTAPDKPNISLEEELERLGVRSAHDHVTERYEADIHAGSRGSVGGISGGDGLSASSQCSKKRSVASYSSVSKRANVGSARRVSASTRRRCRIESGGVVNSILILGGGDSSMMTNRRATGGRDMPENIAYTGSLTGSKDVTFRGRGV